MKKAGPKMIAILILASSPRPVGMPAFGIQQHGPGSSATFAGLIMDSKCATTGSHEAEMKKVEAKDARECTLKCAKNGSFVLYDPTTKTVYQLSDQEKPVPFAGTRVKVSGLYDDWSQTIAVESIEPLS